MNYTMLESHLETPEEGAWAGGIDPLSLYQTLESMPDRRARRGIRYSVALLPSFVLLSTLPFYTTVQRDERMESLQCQSKKQFPLHLTRYLR